MPKAYAQSARRHDVKSALLDAAAELIAEVGWGKVSSRMVAERAGVNNALVHYHFDSMDDLLRRAAERFTRQAFADPTREVWRSGDVARGMRGALRWLDHLDIDSTETSVLIECLVQTRRDPELQREVASALAALRGQLADAIVDADGPLGRASADGVATLLLALLDGLLLHRVVDPTLKLNRTTKALEQMLVGLEPERAGR